MTNLSLDINNAYSMITGKLEEWMNQGIKMLPNLVVAVLVLFLFVLLAKLLRRIFDRIFKRITDNKSLRSLLVNILYVTVIAIGTFIALSILNLDGTVTSLLAGAGVIGLALGFAFQDIAANFMAGTLMSVRKPFREGDLLKTNDFFGIVQKINLRTTELHTMQGQMILIPNSAVFKNPITNYSYTRRRRIDLPVGVTYDTDLPFAKKVAKEAVEGLEGIEKDSVSIFFTEFGNSSINFTIRYWVSFTNKQAEYLAARDQGIIAIKKAFDANDITIPFPIRTLDVGDVDFPGIFNSFHQATSGGNKPGGGSPKT